jgi:2,4-dienoyl-CoA reductase (NADPH2)
VAAERGHAVTLFEAQPQIGGQLDLARRVPGKEEFNETLRYFSNRLRDAGVDLRLSTRVDLASLQAGAFEEVVLAAGVRPRELDFPGADHPKVVSYPSVLRGEVTVGRRVAIIGAGGIGFDVAEMLREDAHEAPELGRWLAEWGVDMGTWGQDPAAPRGGLGRPNHPKSVRTLHMLQRKPTRPGLSLGKTTGWIHRARLQGVGVEFLSGVRYRKVDDLGLHIEVGGVGRVLEVDHVVVCAGQLSENGLLDGLQAAGVRAHLIGGARLAAELDALRAIHEGAALAASF